MHMVLRLVYAKFVVFFVSERCGLFCSDNFLCTCSF